MTEALVTKYSRLATPHLEPAERILDIAAVIPTRGASGSGIGLSAAVGGAIARIGAVKGGPGTIAGSFPGELPALLALICVTDTRVLFLLTDGARKTAKVLWQAPRSDVIGIERRPRLQVMAKFRMHFVDGSSASLLTMRRRTIDALASVLGPAGKP
jgi:hypothetical protein